jgi:hypothetical protein
LFPPYMLLFPVLQWLFLFFPLVGPPESLHDWTHGNETGICDQQSPTKVFSREHWLLVRCQNGKNFICFLLWFSVVTGLLVWILEFCFRFTHSIETIGCFFNLVIILIYMQISKHC